MIADHLLNLRPLNYDLRSPIFDCTLFICDSHSTVYELCLKWYDKVHFDARNSQFKG